jgi:hypothetical protein
MVVNQTSRPADDFSKRGQEIYDRNVHPGLRPDDQGKFVAIDIDSSVFELDHDDFTATERLLARQPQARIWLARVGQRAAYRLGGICSRGAAS